MNNFDSLIEIENETITQIEQTSKFEIGLFFQKMEQEFANNGFRKPFNGGQQRILVMSCDNIGAGDFIMFSPAIREIRANFPSAFITLVANKKFYNLAEFCPYVNEVIPFTTQFDNNNIAYVLKTAFNFAKEHFWNKYYDLSFFTASKTMHIFLSYLSGAKKRIGYTHSPDKKDLAGIFLNHPVLFKLNVIHSVLRNLYVLKECGLTVNRTDIEIWYGMEDTLQAQQLLKDFTPNRIKVVVCIGASTPERKYPVEKYLEALKKIIEKGASIIIVGGHSDIEDSNFLQENLPTEFVKNLTPLKLNWRVTAAVIAQTHLYIGNDTGTAHCAAAAHIPAIVLTRESEDFIKKTRLCEYYAFYPWQTEVIRIPCKHALEGCENRTCWAGKTHCIAQIDPDEIVSAFDEMIFYRHLSKVKRTGVPPIVTQNLLSDEIFSRTDFY